ncbi:MAG: iron ABC transporter permease [Deltaproteobacteria bacterium]|jgi:iron complex transport system permease protein|nr:iron ABC transporter permease [Deltaproteobacteria bacterium]
MNRRAIYVAALVFILATILALPLGRYPVTVWEIGGALWANFLGEPTAREREISFLFLSVRLPRIFAAILVGASLSLSGAVYQSVFRNPLVSPGILGVLAGASAGGAVGIVVFSSWPLTQILACAGGVFGVTLSLALSRLYPRSPLLALLVGGLVCGSFFTAVASLFKYVADVDNQLPELVYWLMGTLSRTTGTQLAYVAPLLTIGVLALAASGRTVNALSLGEEEALSLGVNAKLARLKLIGLATMVCSLSVVLAGIVNWVGLVIPHVARLVLGPNNLTVLPASALFGATFVLLTDAVVRSTWTAEFPLGVFTAIICLPLFAFSLWRDWARS